MSDKCSFFSNDAFSCMLYYMKHISYFFFNSKSGSCITVYKCQVLNISVMKLTSHLVHFEASHILRKSCLTSVNRKARL